MTEENIDTFASQLKSYARLQLQLLKLQGIEATASAGSELISKLLSWTVLLLAIAFFGIAGAFCLSMLLNSFALGFLAAGCFFLLLWIVLLLLRKRQIAVRLKDKIICTLSPADPAEPSEL